MLLHTQLFYIFKIRTFILFYFLLSAFTSPLPPPACGGSQARGLIRAVAADLCHSHRNLGSKPCLPPTAQLTAMLDP